MTRSAFDRFRLWLAWKVMPVEKELISPLICEADDNYPEEYDTIGQIAYFIGLTDESYFD